MAWGAFSVHNCEHQIIEVHIVPCNDEGKMYIGHVLSEFCECCPEIDPETQKPLYIHNQLH